MIATPALVLYTKMLQIPRQFVSTILRLAILLNGGGGSEGYSSAHVVKQHAE